MSRTVPLRPKYLEYISRGSVVDVYLGKSICPDCGLPLIKGRRMAKSPRMLDEHGIMNKEFPSVGCVSCLIEYCYDEDATMYFRPVPLMVPKHKKI